MVCTRCSSDKLSKFTAEMNIHFPGLEGLDKPPVWIFPEIIVCLQCGFAEFSIPENELRKLAKEARLRA